MTLYTQLQQARSEEDVKDAGKCSSYAMFTQLLHYVQAALNRGDTVPPFLAVIDTEKAALMKSADVLPFFADIMHDGTLSSHANLPAELLHKNGSPVFSLGGKNFELGNREGNRPDDGWYQIRNALKARNASGDSLPVDFSCFEAAYQSLTDKLRPQVFSLGFLR